MARVALMVTDHGERNLWKASFLVVGQEPNANPVSVCPHENTGEGASAEVNVKIKVLRNFRRIRYQDTRACVRDVQDGAVHSGSIIPDRDLSRF